MKRAALYIVGTLVTVGVGYVIYHFSGGGGKNPSFNQSYKDAIERLDKIDSALNHANDIISETHRKLNDIKLSMDTIKNKQLASNGTVATNDEILKKNLQAKEYELNQLKKKYKLIQSEKEVLSNQLDSLANIIAKD